LIDAGAQIDCKDVNGWTPLHVAARENSLNIVKVRTPYIRIVTLSSADVDWCWSEY